MPSTWRTPPAPVRLRRRDRALRRAALAMRRLPPSVVRPLAGPSRVNARGDALDPHVALLLRLEEATGRGIAKEEVAPARRAMREGIALIAGPPTPVAQVEDLVVAGDLPARRYAHGPGPRPGVVYFHGGGWVSGDLETHDAFCRRLAVEGGLVVVSVDYRLAPEHPFPEPLVDGERAWAWVAAHAAELGIDPERLAVGGDSAGGNLSAVLCQRLRDGACEGPLPAAQLLIYPSTDFRRLDDSHREFAEGLLLTADNITWFKGHYAAPDDTDPRASPRLHPDLTGLPPAVVTTAGFDPLRDEGDGYARDLQAAGVPVAHREERGLVHGYLQLDAVSPAADRAVAGLIADLRSALSSRP